MGKYNTAVSYYEQALAIFQTIGNKESEAAALGNLGNVYYSWGEYDTAVSYFEQALAIFQTIGNKAGEAASLGNLGTVYASWGNTTRSHFLL
ncbi:MAG: tetratricopeptide repeat protein [Ardenticatenaceae bacterium]|nr:tetratricopeptide repeat protein [Ardenticatenaceae bacterium]